MGSWANPQVRAAAVCVVVALVYLFLWPGRKNPDRVRQLPLFQRIVIRWFHSLSWLLIAAACFYWSKLFAAVAGVVYLMYIFTLNRSRPGLNR
jgi:hypothetical protein